MRRTTLQCRVRPAVRQRCLISSWFNSSLEFSSRSCTFCTLYTACSSENLAGYDSRCRLQVLAIRRDRSLHFPFHCVNWRRQITHYYRSSFAVLTESHFRESGRGPIRGPPILLSSVDQRSPSPSQVTTETPDGYGEYPPPKALNRNCRESCALADP